MIAFSYVQMTPAVRMPSRIDCPKERAVWMIVHLSATFERGCLEQL